MKPSPSRSKLVLLFAAASLVAGAAMATLAVPVAARFAKPPVVATVNLEEAFNQLNERTEQAGKIDQQASTFKAELDKLSADLKNQENKLQYEQGEAKKQAASTLIQMRANAEVRAKVCNALLDQSQAEVFAALYRKIEDAARRLAMQNGYTMVLVTDENVKVPDGPSQDTQRTISLKRFLYVDRSAHDITADVVTLMNNEFKAGVAPAAPGAPSPAPATTPK